MTAAKIVKRPWDRQITEATDEWELFSSYLLERNVKRVAESYFPDDKFGVGEKYVRDVQKSRHWGTRVQAYDRWLNEQREAAVTHMVKLEMRTIARRRVKILRDMFNVVERVKQQVMPDNMKPEDKIKLGDAVTYTKVASVLLEEYRQVEKSNPADDGRDNPKESQLASAQERLTAMIEGSIGSKPATSEPPAETPPVLQ